MYRMIFNRLGSLSLFAILFTAFLVWYVCDSYQYDKDMDAFEKADRQRVYRKVQA